MEPKVVEVGKLVSGRAGERASDQVFDCVRMCVIHLSNNLSYYVITRGKHVEN